MTWAALGSAAALAAAVGAAVLCGGCASPDTTLGYYAQSVRGHLDLLQRARPIDDWLADPATPAPRRERLVLARQLRQFAVQQLALPDNASYTRFADLGRSAAVWNVVAAPELSLVLKTWCYPVMGCVGYRGYFDRLAADAEAGRLQAVGLDTSVYGVPAYSTLGWTNWIGGDPLLNTLVDASEGQLARLIFHELAHQQVYLAGDTPFNESYATAVEGLGLARWQAGTGHTLDDPAAAQRAADVRALTRRTRDALAALYGGDAPDTAKRQQKAELMAAMREQLARWKASPGGPWAGYTGYDAWFARANNAALGLQAAYDSLVPGFERLFHAQGDDFARFHAEVRRLAGLPAEQRRALLSTSP